MKQKFEIRNSKFEELMDEIRFEVFSWKNGLGLTKKVLAT